MLDAVTFVLIMMMSIGYSVAFKDKFGILAAAGFGVKLFLTIPLAMLRANPGTKDSEITFSYRLFIGRAYMDLISMAILSTIYY